MNNIIGRYRITYKSGHTQEKNLISHDDYVNIIKFNKEKIFEFETLLEQKNVNKKELRIKISECESEIYKAVGSDSWFTDGSPLYGAYKTGILSLPKNQGGDHKCDVKRIK